MSTTTVYHSNEACKYGKIPLAGEGTLYLSFRDFKELLSEQFPDRPFDCLRAIDYGCGAGRSTRYLKSLGIDHIEGFDISADMIREAKEFDPDGVYKETSSADLPLVNNSNDLALMSFVTVAINEKNELIRIFKELHRVLKPGGLALSLTLSESFWNPEFEWVSYRKDYPENHSFWSGQKVRLKIKEINLELTVSYWPENDIVACAGKAGLALVKIHEPLGKPEDAITWKDEQLSSPYSIFVLRKPG